MGIQPAGLELPRPDAVLVAVDGLHLADLAPMGMALLCQGRCLEKKTAQAQEDDRLTAFGNKTAEAALWERRIGFEDGP